MGKIKLTKEEADKIMRVKGNVSGTIFRADQQFVLEERGKEAVAKVERRLEELGYPIKFEEISSFKWYPEAHACLVYLLILEVFNWDKSRAFNIGYAVPSYSTLTKLLMKYISIEKLLKEASRYWRKHFDFGEMRCVKFDGKRKSAVLRLNDFKKFHQTLSDYIRGYITRLVEMVVKSKNVKVEQIKSLYHNNSYDEFKIAW